MYIAGQMPFPWFKASKMYMPAITMVNSVTGTTDTAEPIKAAIRKRR